MLSKKIQLLQIIVTIYIQQPEQKQKQNPNVTEVNITIYAAFTAPDEIQELFAVHRQSITGFPHITMT
jgi:hypothetical protein